MLPTLYIVPTHNNPSGVYSDESTIPGKIKSTTLLSLHSSGSGLLTRVHLNDSNDVYAFTLNLTISQVYTIPILYSTKRINESLE